MEFREGDEMPRVAEATGSSDNCTSLLLKKARKLLRGNKRKLSPSPSCSVNSPFCEGPGMKRMFLVEHNEEVMQQSGDAERVGRYRTGLSSSSVSETDTLLLEMTLGGNKKLWEMHSLGFNEGVIKEFGNDKTRNNSTTLSPPPSCSVSSSFPVEIHGARNEGFEVAEALRVQMEVQRRLHEQMKVQRRLHYGNEGFEVTEALRVQMEVQRRLHEQIEVQKRLELRIQTQGKYLRKLIERHQELDKERDRGVHVKEQKEAGSLGEREKMVNVEEERKEMAHRFHNLQDGYDALG